MVKRALIRFVYRCLKLYWFVARPTTFGVQCVIQHDGAILMVRNTYGHQHWTFPGGGMATRETAEEAIRREVREEVGLDILNLREIGTFVATIDYKKDCVTVFVGDSRGRGLTIDVGEILEAGWVDPQHLPRLSTSAKKIIAMWERSAR
jgi:8-oxo-dGTP diphosphatase